MPELYVVENPATRFNRIRDRAMADWPKTDRQAKRLEKELKKIDPYLEVGYADARVAQVALKERMVGVVPARWHVIRRNPKGIDAYFPIMGPNGEYAEPELRVAEDMKRADLWRRGAMLELRDRQEREAKRQQTEELLGIEQRKDEVRHNYEAAKRVRGDGGLARNFDRKRKGEGLKKLILPDEAA